MNKKSKTERPSKTAIEEYFCQYGKVVKFELSDGNNGAVTFATKAEAQCALSTLEHVVNGCMLKLVHAKHPSSHPK